MTKQSVNNIVKSVFLSGILSVVILLSAQDKALANAGKRSDSAINVTKAENVSVKYVGSSEDGVFFNIKYRNDKGETFTIVITDENGETLYEDSFNEKSFDKKFLLPDDSEASYLTISLKSGRENFTQSYNVSISTNSVKDVVVSKN